MSDSQLPVPIGNWTQYIKNALTGSNNFMQFLIGKSGGGFDSPTENNCDKSFHASYQCGTGQAKIINIANGARGQTVDFDCTAETKACNAFKLTLGDDGNLTMTNSQGTTNWTSNTNKTGLSIEKYKAVNGKYKRNFLKSGEILNLGEFIGSPSGNCYLQMVKKQDGNAGLELRYTMTDCAPISKPDSDTGTCPATKPYAYAGNNIPGGYCCDKKPTNSGYYGPNVLDHCNGSFVKCSKSSCKDYSAQSGNSPTSNELYVIPQINSKNLGKIGYVSDDGELRSYPEDMTSYNTSYYSMGKYDNEGNDIEYHQNSTLQDCKDKCNSNKECAGLVFDSNGGVCKIKNDKMFPNSIRVPSETAELYVRSKSVANNASCTKNVDASTAMEWELFPPGKKMSVDTLCQLGLVTQDERNSLDEANQELRGLSNTLESKLKNLTEEDTKLVQSLGYNINKLQKDLKNYKNVEEDAKNNNKQMDHAQAMHEDSNLNMISENYYYLLWTILAIVVIIGSIKATR